MEKKKLQDVVPPTRSIRNIVKDKPAARRIPKSERFEEGETYTVEQYREEVLQEEHPKRARSGRKLVITGIVVLSIAVLAFAFSLIYASATVKITPKSENVSVSGTYTAKKDAKPTELQYEVMTLTKQRGEVVPATSGEHVETKARGTVVLYNAYSSSPQMLVVNTRLENTKGQIYRTEKAVTIPGYKNMEGRIVPGTIEVSVLASEPGSAYNMELTDLTGDFKVTAFKGDPKYEAFYGRLKSDITGGYVGVNKIIAPQVASSTRAQMRNQLKTDIIAEAKAQTPEGFVLYDDAIMVEFSSLANTQKTNQEVIMNEKATLYGVMLKEEELNKFIATKELQKFANGKVDGNGIEDLDFTIINSKDFNPRLGTQLSFSVKGDYRLIGEFPESELKSKLKGTTVKDIAGVLSQYGTISSADVILRPFWKRTFPLREDRITIEKVI